MGEYYVKKSPDKELHKEFEYLGNLANDPVVDSNDRTGGLEYPLRVTLSRCANGPALSSQLADACILNMDVHCQLKTDIEYLSMITD